MTSGNGLDRYPGSDDGTQSSRQGAETRARLSYVVIGPGLDLNVGVDFNLAVRSQADLIPRERFRRGTAGHVTVLVIPGAVTRTGKPRIRYPDDTAKMRTCRRDRSQ